MRANGDLNKKNNVTEAREENELFERQTGVVVVCGE